MWSMLTRVFQNLVAFVVVAFIVLAVFDLVKLILWAAFVWNPDLTCLLGK